MNNADMPAMPLSRGAEERLDEGYGFGYMGLTKREHFAGLAMQGILANQEWSANEPYTIAKKSVAAADALLAALEPKGVE